MVHGRHILYLALRVCAYNKLATLYVTYVGYVFFKNIFMFGNVCIYDILYFFYFYISYRFECLLSVNQFPTTVFVLSSYEAKASVLGASNKLGD